MKNSVELKQEREAKIARMEQMHQGAETAKRNLSPEETTEWDNLDAEIKALDKDIARAEAFELLQTQRAESRKPTPKPDEFSRESAKFDVSKAVLEFSKRGILTGREAEINDELSARVGGTNGILIPFNYRANENTTSTHATLIGTNPIDDISIIGKEPIHEKMGCTILPNLNGIVKLPYKSPTVGTKTAVGTDLSNDANDPGAGTLSPERFGVTDIWGLDLLKTQSPVLHNKIMGDMQKGAMRALTAEVYTVAIAAATEVAAADALDNDSFIALMAAIEGDNCAFAMERATFFTLLGTKLDTGSGKFLAELIGTNQGRTHSGVPAYFSSLFADGTGLQYLLYADWAEMFVGYWGALELIVNPFTYAKKAQVEMTLNVISDVASRNPAAFRRSVDLEA